MEGDEDLLCARLSRAPLRVPLSRPARSTVRSPWLPLRDSRYQGLCLCLCLCLSHIKPLNRPHSPSGSASVCVCRYCCLCLPLARRVCHGQRNPSTPNVAHRRLAPRCLTLHRQRRMARPGAPAARGRRGGHGHGAMRRMRASSHHEAHSTHAQAHPRAGSAGTPGLQALRLDSPPQLPNLPSGQLALWPACVRAWVCQEQR